MQEQDQAGYTDATINRRLAAISLLYNELCLLDAARFPVNPIYPRPPLEQAAQPAHPADAAARPRDRCHVAMWGDMLTLQNHIVELSLAAAEYGLNTRSCSRTSALK